MARRYETAEKILKELGENATKAAKDALADGTELVVAEAKSRCPVYRGNDSRVVKGALRDSIHAVKLKGGAGVFIPASVLMQAAIPSLSTMSYRMCQTLRQTVWKWSGA